MKVFLGRLTKPLQVKNVNPETTIESFCNSLGVAFNTSVRVNGKQVPRTYLLREGDIVLSIESVSGGY